MNRVKSSAFPNSVIGVITQPMQFAPYRSGKVEFIIANGPNSTCIRAAQEVLAGARIGDYLFFMTQYWADYYRIKNYTMIGHHAFFYRWETYDPEPGEITVLMDPGMAFGTGTHETTRLCAGFVEEYTKPGCSVLDVGCGSGILAIAASRLGAGKCFACDIDPVAVRVAKENTELNHTGNVTCAVSDLLKQAERTEGGYDLIVANIVADIIIRLAPDVGDYLAPDGVFVVSGIIAERAEEVLGVLRSCGYAVMDEHYENGWYAAALKKA